MLLSTSIAFFLAICVLILAVVGIELTLHQPQTPKQLRNVRVLIGITAFAFLGLTVWSTIRGEKEAKSLPGEIAEYIRNNNPPPSTPKPIFSLHAPIGFVASVDGHWGNEAIATGNKLIAFLDERGEAPPRQSGESYVQFLVRSNSWYAETMEMYKKQFADRVIGLIGILGKAGDVDDRAVSLSQNPVNPLGMRALATQLLDGGRKFEAIYASTPVPAK